MTAIVDLNVSTLVFVAALNAWLMSVAMLTIRLAGMRQPAVLFWALAGFCYGAGYLTGYLLLTVLHAPSLQSGLALANSVIMLGHGLVLLGVQRYLEKRLSLWIVVLAPLAVFFGSVLIDPIGNNPVVRVWVLSLVYLYFTCYAAWLMWHNAPAGRRRYRRGLAVVLLLFAVAILVRMFWALQLPGVEPLLAQQSIQVFVSLVSIAFFMAISIALVAMLFRDKEMELQYMARHDALTGLFNRHSLSLFADHELARARRTGQPLSVLLLDLDFFKDINDRFGHDIGDEVLRQVAVRINRTVRQSDIVFRTGGEEFLVMLPETTLSDAEHVAQRLRQALAGEPIDLDDDAIAMTASFGLAQYMPEREDWDRLARRVDRALYAAKRAGRNQIRQDYVPQTT